MDRCEVCRFVYGDHDVPEVATELGTLGSRYADRLRAGVDDAQWDRVLRARPEPGVWSGLEYACHVRDVLLAQRERVFLTLVEDCPSFAPIYPDQRVDLAGYESDDRTRVAVELEVASNLISRAFAGLDAAQWRRRCMYNYPAPSRRTVLWLAQHTLHEGEHHLLDICTVISKSRPGNGEGC